MHGQGVVESVATLAQRRRGTEGSAAKSLGFRDAFAASLLVCLVSVLAVVEPAYAACDAAGAEAGQVNVARTAVADECDCFTSNRASYRGCVLATLATLQGSGALSSGCARYVRDREMRSTCGRPGRVVCCRTRASGATAAFITPANGCIPPPGGSACVSEWDQRLDACTETGCNPAPVCGDGVVERGETCDPSNGTTCDGRCRLQDFCPVESDNVLLACLTIPTTATAAALPSKFLVAYTEPAPGGSRIAARRLDAAAQILDTTPLIVSDQVPEASTTTSFSPKVTSNDSAFYALWGAALDDLPAYRVRGRIVPATGAPIGVNEHASYFVFGQCGTYFTSPYGLSFALDPNHIRFTMREVFYCSGILFEHLTGLVPNFFSVPPGNLSAGSAPLARGTSDIAGAWHNILVTSLSPPNPVSSVYAAWLEPGTPTAFQLSSTVPASSPALAAAGDTFLAVWLAAASPGEDPPSEVRAMRFTRADGPLDPDGGFLVQSTPGGTDAPIVTSDGTTFLVAWREQQAAPSSFIRARRIATDGELLGDEPIAVAPSSAGELADIAATSSSAIAVLTRTESEGTSVRAYLIPE